MNARNKTTIGVMVAGISLLAAWTAPATVLPYTTDGNTEALYHFNGVVADDAGMLADSSGNIPARNLSANGVGPLGSSATPALLNAWDDVGPGGTLAATVPTVASGTDWTVEALLNIRSFLGAAPGERRDFLRFDSGMSMGYRPDGLFEFMIDGGSKFSTASQVQTGVWFHIAMTYQASSGTVKIYQNGTDITSGVGTLAVNENLGGNFRLGHNAGNFDQWFDEVRISNTIRAFTPFDPNEVPAAPVPEPSAVALLALGGAVLWRRARRSNQ